MLEELISEGLTQRKIAERLGCSQSNVKYWMGKFGLKTLPRRNNVVECKKHPNSTFAYSPDGRARCRTCRVEGVRRRRNKLKEDLVAYCGGRCVDCGYSENVKALEFDHLRDKKYPMAVLISGVKRTLAFKEVEKCELVCANCHRIRTAERQDQGAVTQLAE